MKRLSTTRQTAGFTLLEVLVALAVLSIALTATVKGIGDHVNTLTYLKEKTFAHWVGMNQIARLQTSQKWPGATVLSGRETLAEQQWEWSIKVSTTKDARVKRLDVTVASALQPNNRLSELVAYLGKP